MNLWLVALEKNLFVELDSLYFDDTNLVIGDKTIYNVIFKETTLLELVSSIENFVKV